MRTIFRYLQTTFATVVNNHAKQTEKPRNDASVRKQRLPGALSFRTLSDRVHL